MKKCWWKSAVVYQIYPRSFQDSNGDGIGDLNGITRRLPYLRELGVDALWICPFYRSPMKDNGYDISDYCGIDPVFGTMEDFERLTARAKELGIRILTDLVLNHSSDRHPWFQAALADPQSPFRQYYIFRTAEELASAPIRKGSFGDKVWQPVGDGTFYYHTFTKEQPDLNWESPALRAELYRIINFWIRKGVSGFRLDAVTFIKKSEDFLTGRESCPPENQKGILGFLQEMRRETYGRFDSMTVAEAPGVPYEDLGGYIGPDGAFSMIFDFSYTDLDIPVSGNWFEPVPFTVKELRNKIMKSQTEVQKAGWGAVYLENHDQPRSLNKYLPENEIGFHSASCLAAAYFFLRGTPFIYQGQELGMTNADFCSLSEINDVASFEQYRRAREAGLSEQEAFRTVRRRSRDNSRTPMQWSSEENAGFTDGAPWLKINPNYREINAERERNDPGSLFHFYRRMISLRREYAEFLVDGTIGGLLPECGSLIAYRRTAHEQSVWVLCNLSDRPCEAAVPGNPRPLLDNYGQPDFHDGSLSLRPYEAAVLLMNAELLKGKK